VLPSPESRTESNARVADQVLSEKFNHERQLELEASDPSKQPPPLEDFIQNGPWTISDKPGTHDVELTREFGNEKYASTLSQRCTIC
jgi:Mitochondrial glycoprotein